jgi:hypothetical protein
MWDGTLMPRSQAEADDIARSLKKAKGQVSISLVCDMHQVNQQYADLENERGALLAASNMKILSDDEIKTLLEYRRDTLEGLAHPTPADKRRMFEILRVAVVVTDGQAVVSCRISVDPSSFGRQTACGWVRYTTPDLLRT